MYLAHFGLREPPFSITPDTGFFFSHADHQAALNTLLIAVRNGEGFIKITGEVGTGKTLLCRQFLASINRDAADGEARFVTAYIPNPYLEPRTLLLALAEEIGIELAQDADQYHLLKSLTQALLDFARSGKRVVLCLDEAQAMPLESLEAIRLLSNLETEKRKLLQIILFGQPELNHKLQQDSIRQLNQRIMFHYHLGPLGREAVEFYLAHRLRVADYPGTRLFSPAAVRRLHAASGGIPRLLNILAHKSLMLTYGEGGHRVQGRHVRAAAQDTEAARSRPWRRWAVAAFLLAAAGAAWGWMSLR